MRIVWNCVSIVTKLRRVTKCVLFEWKWLTSSPARPVPAATSITVRSRASGGYNAAISAAMTLGPLYRWDTMSCKQKYRLQWRHNGRDGVSNHQPHNCLLDRLFRRRSKKTSKPRVTGLCAGNSPVTGEFPAQRASNAENVSIWWRHHAFS